MYIKTNFEITILKLIASIQLIFFDFFSILSKHVEHKRWPFLTQNVLVDLSMSFLHIKQLKIGVTL